MKRTSTTANSIVFFYDATDMHNDSFLYNNTRFCAYRKRCTPSCYTTFIPLTMLFFKNRNWKLIAALTAGTLLFVYLLFVVFLKATLP